MVLLSSLKQFSEIPIGFASSHLLAGELDYTIVPVRVNPSSAGFMQQIHQGLI